MKSAVEWIEIVKAAAVRHRTKIFDTGFILAALAAAAVFLFEADLFLTEGQLSQAQETLEFDELMVLVTLTLVGVLAYAFRRAVEHRRENALRIEAEKEVLSLAFQDPLTGLPNRRQFDDALASALSALPAEPEAHAVLMLDLNGFKKINDVHGHPVGDQVLLAIGARLLRAVRQGDLVARLGGDEFVVLARNVGGAEGATNIALRIIDCMVQPVNVSGTRHPVGAAIGVALSPHDGDTAEELLRKADVALYRAKAERKSTVRFFEDEMDARLRQRDQLERDLRAAVAEDAFILRFQPSRVRGEEIVGFEALPRWLNAEMGELEPERFVPVAEETGLLAELTEQLLRKACTAAAAWPTNIRLSFNLPGQLISEPGFGLRILAAVAATGFSPNRLDLEIDEGALFREAEAAQAILPPLRHAGIRIIADHFGTGYSDLQNLNRLKLDGIKIDRSFIEQMTDSRQAAVLVKAMIGIGQGLDLAVMADGVGDGRQEAALAAQGCDVGQGALYDAPLSADEAARLVVRKAAARKRA